MESTTSSFGEGKRLSTELRAVTPEQIATLTTRLEYEQANAKDIVAPSTALAVRPQSDGGLKLALTAKIGGDTAFAGINYDELFNIGNIAHEQLAEKLDVPMRYYRRMQEDAPGLLANNINYWMSNEPGDFLLRTLDSRVRAVLSRRYRTLDNYDLFFHTFDVARDAGAVLTRMDLSDSRFYMRLLLPDFAAKITGRGEDLTAKGKFFSSGYRKDNGSWQVTDDDDPNGDWIFPQIVVSNSEVGRGGLNVESGALRVTCANLIIVGQTLHKIHLGEDRNAGFQIQSDTQEAKDKAVWLEVRDLVRATFNETSFRAMVEAMNKAQASVLAEPVEAVDTIVKHYGFSEDVKKSILNELLSPSYGVNPGSTLWGLSNAVNVMQHGSEAVDGSYDLARIGGEILRNAGDLVKVK